jgi:hypothetical protein
MAAVHQVRLAGGADHPEADLQVEVEEVSLSQ